MAVPAQINCSLSDDGKAVSSNSLPVRVMMNLAQVEGTSRNLCEFRGGGALTRWTYPANCLMNVAIDE